jgi:hypothetical protein
MLAADSPHPIGDARWHPVRTRDSGRINKITSRCGEIAVRCTQQTQDTRTNEVRQRQGDAARERHYRGGCVQPAEPRAEAIALVAVGVVRWWACWSVAARHLLSNKPPDAAATAGSFVGSTCAECHRPQADLWRPSSTTWRCNTPAPRRCSAIQRRELRLRGRALALLSQGRQVLRRDHSPDGKLAVFEVKYASASIRCSSTWWSFAMAACSAVDRVGQPATNKGGQRWFHLYPNERSGTTTSCIGPS